MLRESGVPAARCFHPWLLSIMQAAFPTDSKNFRTGYPPLYKRVEFCLFGAAARKSVSDFSPPLFNAAKTGEVFAKRKSEVARFPRSEVVFTVKFLLTQK